MRCKEKNWKELERYTSIKSLSDVFMPMKALRLRLRVWVRVRFTVRVTIVSCSCPGVMLGAAE